VRSGGVQGWSDPTNKSKGLHSRNKCVRACYEGGVNRMLVDQPPDFVQKYGNAPHHRPEPCRPSLFPGFARVGGSARAPESGDAARAIDHYLTALSIAEESSDRAAEGEVCHSLGVVYRKIGDYPRAISYHDKRLAIAHELSDSEGEGNAYLSLGLCFYSLERYHKAATVSLSLSLCASRRSAHVLCVSMLMRVTHQHGQIWCSVQTHAAMRARPIYVRMCLCTSLRG